ncbi:MAG: Ig-like domain-containing protein [Dehalococcoidia bacterium]
MNEKRWLAITLIVAAVLSLGPSCTTPVNRDPSITNLASEGSWITPFGGIQVTCSASDADGDELSYEWTTTGGYISGTGAIVTWIAPEEVGMYDIAVVVRDGKGGEDTGLLTLTASNGPPPMIQSLVVTAQEPKYLKETATGYKVGKTKEYYIECVASGVTELVYEWSCNGGEISPAGSVTTWTAPDASCDVTVTAKVYDSLGNWVRKSIVFKVVSCSSCEFG